jgi:hypothetical protein
MGAYGCMGNYFCFGIQFFFQQKLVVIVLKLQSHDWGREISRRLGLEINNKICNVSLVMVFNV